MEDNRFVYKEGDIIVGESFCEFCANYNDGKRNENCPKENLEAIIRGDIKCPKFVRKYQAFWDELLGE